MRERNLPFKFEILKGIAFEGESSKIKLQDYLNAHYPDISDAIELLKKRKIIERSREDLKVVGLRYTINLRKEDWK